MKISEVLSDATKWIKGLYATDDKGRTCSEVSDQACHFCLFGAMKYAGIGRDEHESIARIIGKIFPQRVRKVWRSETIITTFNDSPSTTFADIRRVIKSYENSRTVKRA